MSISISRFKKLNKERRELRKIIFEDPRFGFEKGEKYMTQAFDGIISAQQYGIRFENYIIEKCGGERVKQKLGRGDLLYKNKYAEIKVSILNDSNNVLNLVQLRLYQEIDYYIFMALDNREDKVKVYYYLLSKEDMEREVLICKASNAHGTKEANNENNNKELRLSISIDDKNRDFVRWNELYGYKSLKSLLKNI